MNDEERVGPVSPQEIADAPKYAATILRRAAELVKAGERNGLAALVQAHEESGRRYGYNAALEAVRAEAVGHRYLAEIALQCATRETTSGLLRAAADRIGGPQ